MKDTPALGQHPQDSESSDGDEDFEEGEDNDGDDSKFPLYCWTLMTLAHRADSLSAQRENGNGLYILRQLRASLLL